MREATGAHKSRRHHGVHAVPVESKLAPPIVRQSRCQNAILSDLIPPPVFLEDATQIILLALNSADLRRVVIHRGHESRRPPLLHDLPPLDWNSARGYQQATQLASPWQIKP
jgi:hypothetical protein